MLEVKVSETEVRKLYLEELEKHLKKIDGQLIFWDTKMLVKKTSMSLTTIYNEFFYDPRFPKYRVGRKWYFPAKKTEEFLLMWLEEQNRM